MPFDHVLAVVPVSDIETANAWYERLFDGPATNLAGVGLEPGAIQDVTKGVQLCPLSDPDGNVVTLIGSFREDY